MWKGKHLYTWRGFGAYPESRWCADGYNKEDIWVAAEYRTRRRIRDLKQVGNVPAP